MAKKLKHDVYLETLCEEIKPLYDHIYTNVTIFSKKKRPVAEIDVMGVKEDRYDIYEVKCSYRIVKSRKQLLKIKRLMPNVNKLFFFCGEAESLEQITIASNN